MKLIKPMQMGLKLHDWIVLATCIALVGVLGVSIDPLVPPAFDVEALTWIRSNVEGISGDALIQIYRFSGVGFTAFLVLASIIYVTLKRWWNDLRLLVLASGGILIIIDLWLKPWFDRHRPPEKLLSVDGRSFPSGHAAGAVAFYGAILLILAARYPRWRTPIAIGACLWISLVWLSTLYVRAHWPTDLLAGAATGLAWLTLCKALWTVDSPRKSVQPPL